LRDTFFLNYWKCKISRDFWRWVRERDAAVWWRNAEERQRTCQAGLKAISYAVESNWWEWDGGSFPFFWRWNLEFIREIRDGIPPRFIRDPPACMDWQRPNPNPEAARRERSKLFKVVQRGYLRLVSRRDISSLMHYFLVPKGDKDIRMVYDSSKCGLNAVTFAPWFAVPTASSLERMILPHTYQGDNDFGEMFLNFQLHQDMQRYTGVDGSDLLNNKDAASWLDKAGNDFRSAGVTLTWDRPASMGLACSPYQCVQTGSRGKRIILGDKDQESNPFQWKEIVLNLPGDSRYDPRMPWIYKRRRDGCIAADVIIAPQPMTLARHGKHQAEWPNTAPGWACRTRPERGGHSA
jgi:hypothetical protein